LGAGVTLKFVGSWKSLLGKLLGRRFVSMWLSEGKQFSEIADVLDKDYFSEFFTAENNLELGEFLLSDDIVRLPSECEEDVIAWQERLFSRQVCDLIRLRVDETLEQACTYDTCPQHSTCPLRDKHTLCDIYELYRKSKDFAAPDSCDSVECSLIKGYATTTAVVEFLLSGKVRFVINYNFDTIVEEMLCEVIASGSSGSPLKEIHIWTYGDNKEPKSVMSCKGSRTCRVIYHQGLWDDDAKSLHKNDALHVFHVHGIAAGSKMEDVSGQLVFSQHSYHVYQDVPLSWSNQVLQYLFSKFNVIAVGFSGADDNFRYFATEHAKTSMVGLSAYREESQGKKIVLLRAKASYRKAIEDKLGKPKSKEKVERFLMYCTRMVSQYYRDYYGVDIKWFGERYDIAMELHRIAVARD